MVRIMNAGDFKTELKRLCGGYIFAGEEGYLKSYYKKEVRAASVAEGDVFNHIKFSEENYSPERIMTAIESLPVMADKKLIELSGVPFDRLPDEEFEALCMIFSQLPDYEYNILLVYTEPDELDSGTAKQTSKNLKRLSEFLKPVIFERETPSKLHSWIVRHFGAEAIFAPPDAATELLERCGGDMSALSNEIDKLCCYLKFNRRNRLSVEDVVLVSAGSREIAAFDFANSILNGKPDDAFSILSELKLRKEKPEIILNGISRVICDLSVVKALSESGLPPAAIAQKLKMHAYKVGLYIKSSAKSSSDQLCRLTEKCVDADMKIKNTSLDSYEVLDRLVAETAVRI